MAFEEIKKMVIEELSIDAQKVTPEARLAEDLGADSIDAVQMIMNIEEKYNIQISDEQAQNIKTIQDMVDFVEKNKQ